MYKQMIRQRAGAILNITSNRCDSRAADCRSLRNFKGCDDWVYQVSVARGSDVFGIKVNAIAAGIFDTDLAQALPERLDTNARILGRASGQADRACRVRGVHVQRS